MRITVRFFSYFKDLAGRPDIEVDLPEASTIQDLLESLSRSFPKFGAMRKSILIAVGLDYQDRAYILKNGDEVSLFPPVQGG